MVEILTHQDVCVPCADLDLKTGAIFIHFSLLLQLSCSPLPFTPFQYHQLALSV